MNGLDTTRVTNRVILEVAGTIATNGIQELSRVGTLSQFVYVRKCLVSTAYNALRAMPGFDLSYGEFFRAIEVETESLLGQR